MTHTIQLTPAQAALMADRIDTLNQAQQKATEVLAILTAGHVPDGSAFVSVNRETGALIVHSPLAVD